MTMYGNVEVSLFHTVRTLEETKELDDFLKDERLVIMKMDYERDMRIEAGMEEDEGDDD